MTATGQTTQFYYQPLYKPNQLICGTGQTAVVTGWTVRKIVAKRLDSSAFAVIGNLYSPARGISLLIRNLLYNPHVQFLVVLNATQEDRNSGACQCLLDFFRHGFEAGQSDTGRDCWVIKSPVSGYIDREINAEALEALRDAIECVEAESIDAAVTRVREFAKTRVSPWGEPRQFPMPEVTPTVLPGVRYGHRIEGKTIAETWVKIIHRIKTTGTIRPTGYDGKWQELIDLMAIVTDEPPDFYFPEPNYLPIDRAFLNEYIGQMVDDAPTREGVKYTYGQRLRSWFGRDQIEQVIDKLIGDRDSARAAMSLWDVRDGEANESPPCLNHIWTRIVDNELSMTATFRSNDMFSAWSANAMGLRALQQHIRDEIARRSQWELTMGPLITVSQSAHIYDDCWENADKVIQSQYPKICRQREFSDPAGNFVVSVRDGEIVVEHMTSRSGEIVNCYAGKTARSLYQQIAANCPGLQVEHALYLGTELQKAEFAISRKNNIKYEQDRR
jgi:thymidylate synthase